MSSNKPIHISSKLDIEAESLHETIRNPATGETKHIDTDKPHETTISETLTTNPVKYETKGTSGPRVTEGKTIQEVSETTGDDTSQL
ncbi:hypothetical protein MBLNU230_g5622t1 [Neophaeotheca triangularis]